MMLQKRFTMTWMFCDSKVLPVCMVLVFVVFCGDIPSTVSAEEEERVLRVEAVPAPPRNAQQPMRVRSTGGLLVVAEENKMIYNENVRMDYPSQQLIMECDRLEVIREEPKAKVVEGEGGGSAVDAAGGAQQGVGNQIKWAIATGNVIIQKMDEEGNRSIGQGERAVFDVESGEMVLSGEPLLKVGNEIFQGSGPESRIILRSDGGHRTEGPIITITDQGNAILPGGKDNLDEEPEEGASVILPPGA